MISIALAALAASLASAAVQRPLVVVNDVTDPVSLDPHREFDASSDNIINQIFDGLVRLTADGRIAPALAESWTRVDDLTLEFKLRRGVTFHDGEPFTARAVKFSLDRQLDPKKPAPNAGLLDTLAGAEVVDDYTVRLKTKKRDGVLLNKLPMFLKVLPPAYLAEKGDAGFAAHPVGTGPFSFERWDKGREIELRANPSYWAGPAAVSPLVFKFLPMKEQARALRGGAADMVTDLSGLETEGVARDPRLRVLKGEDFYAVSLIPNSRRGPFADLRLRRALTAAVDPHDLVRYAAKGNGRPMTGFTMPGEFGHAELDGPRFQPEEARALVAQSSGGATVPIKILVRAEIAQFGKVIAAQLRAAGFEPSLETASQEEVFKRIVRPNLDPKLPPWDGDLLITHYVDPTAHAYFPYMIFVQSNGPYSLARDADFDAAFAEMIGTLSPEKQKEQCARLEKLVYDKRLAYSPVRVIRPYAMRSDLNYEPQVAGMLDFRAASWQERKDAD